MSQHYERHTNHTDEETTHSEDTRRAVGNQALNEVAAETDEVIERVEEVLDEELAEILSEVTELTDEQVLDQVNGFIQRGGQ